MYESQIPCPVFSSRPLCSLSISPPSLPSSIWSSLPLLLSRSLSPSLSLSLRVECVRMTQAPEPLPAQRKPSSLSSPSAARRLYRNLSGKFRVGTAGLEESVPSSRDKERLRKSSVVGAHTHTHTHIYTTLIHTLTLHNHAHSDIVHSCRPTYKPTTHTHLHTQHTYTCICSTYTFLVHSHSHTRSGHKPLCII